MRVDSKEDSLDGQSLPVADKAREETVSVDSVREWEAQLLKDPKNRLAASAFSTTDPTKVLTKRSTVIGDSHIFNIKIPTEGSPVTNQRSSGRCWLFAACNVFRVALIKKYGLKDFELSQNYLFFWDKLEKANYFLEQSIETADEDLEGRLVQVLLESPVQDGGQWDMVANLVDKYGIVPQTLYPDTQSASSSAVMNRLVTAKLREDCLELRRLAKEKSSTLRDTKNKMLQEIHQILVLLLGPPPDPRKAFKWEYYDKDGKFNLREITPKDFAASVSKADDDNGLSIGIFDLFSLVNDPRNEYGKLLTVDKLGNVWGGRDITYVNVEMGVMKKACIDMLKAGMPIFFGCDVGKFSDRFSGIMDDNLVDYELGFNTKLGMTKEQRLRAGESLMTHAMVLTAVHVIDDKPVRWRVENSWGESMGSKGYFVMSDSWMDEFNYQAVVDPKFVSDEVKEVLKQKPKVLPRWDPMGSLA